MLSKEIPPGQSPLSNLRKHQVFQQRLSMAGVVLVCTFPAPLASAQQVDTASTVPVNHAHPVPINLDLSSTERTLTPGHLANLSPVTILEGGQQKSITGSSMITAAERMAVYQVVSTGQQSLNLAAAGNAVGGNFNIGAGFSTYVSSLTVPAGVTAIKDFAANSVLSLVGNLTNGGNLFAISSNPAVTAGTISAANIFNQSNAVISSVLPAAGLPGITSAVTNLNLQVSALNNIINAGTIASSGNLSVIVGGSIVNALPAGVTGTAAIMQAAQNLNILTGTGSLVNSGILAAVSGNINIASTTAQTLTINGIGGRMDALHGIINVGDLTSVLRQNLDIQGGDFAAREINLFSNNGIIRADINAVSGTLSTIAGEAHVAANSNTLVLGNLDLSGDPTYYNTGAIQLTGNISVLEDLSILSGGTLSSTSGLTSITARGSDGQGHQIVLVSGAQLSPVCGNCVSTLAGGPTTSGVITLSPTSATGGDIDFSASTSLQINANSTSGNQSGAAVTLAAFANGSVGGKIILAPNSSIKASGFGTGNNGNVTLLGGATSGTAITVGNIDTTGGTGTLSGIGKVQIVTAQPGTLGNSDITFASAGTPGAALIASSTVQGASISLANTISSKNELDITAGKNITTASGAVGSGRLSSEVVQLSSTQQGTINVSTGTHYLSVNNDGSTTISELDSVTLQTSQVLGTATISAGNITVGAPVTGYDLTLNSSGSVLVSSALVSGTLTVNAATSINTDVSGLITADLLKVQTTNGSIGTSATSRLNIAVNSLSAVAKGTGANAYINQTASGLIGNNSGAIAIGSSSAVGIFDLTAQGAASVISTLTGTVTGTSVVGSTGISATEIDLQSNDIGISTSMVGTTKVFLQANGTRSIGINAPGSTSSDYNLSSTELAFITTGTLAIGSLLSSGGPVTMSATYTAPASGAGLFNLALETPGAFDGTGSSFNAGSKTISIHTGGNLRTGSMTSTSSINLGSGRDLSTTGTVNGSTVSIDGKTVTAEGTVSSSVSTTVSTSEGDIRTTGAGLLSGDFVEIVAITGSIGTGTGDRVNTSANKLLAMSFKGNVYLNQSKAVTVGSSQASKTFDLLSAGQISTSRVISTSTGTDFSNVTAVSGADVSLVTTAGNLNLTNTAAVTASGTLTMTAAGNLNLGATASAANATLASTGGTIQLTSPGADLNITQTAQLTAKSDIMGIGGGKVRAQSLSLTSNTGSINVQTVANKVSASGQGITILESDGLQLDQISVTGRLYVDAGSGNITTTGSISADSILLGTAGSVTLGGSLTAPSLITLIAGGSVTAPTGASLTSDFIQFQTSGSVGTSATNRISITANQLQAKGSTAVSANSIFYLQVTGNVVIGSSTAKGVFDIVSGGTVSTASTLSSALTGNVTNATTALSASDIKIQANDVALATPISATGTVELVANPSQAAGISPTGTTIAAFNIDAAELGRISSQKLTLNTQAAGTGITVTTGYTMPGSGAGSYDLSFISGTGFTSTGANLILGSRAFSLDAQSNVSLSTVSSSQNLTITTKGSVSVASGATVSGLSVNVSAHDLALAGSLSASGGLVTLTPVNAATLSVNTTGGEFSLDSGELSRISATLLTVGNNTSFAGDITLGGTINFSGTGAGKYSLSLATQGNYNATGSSVTSDKSIVVTANNITTGSASGSSVTYTGHSILLNGVVSGSIIVKLSSDTNLVASAGGLVTGDFTQLSAGTGDIGGGTNDRLQVSTNMLGVTTGGSAYINQLTAVKIAGSSASGVFDLASAGKVTAAPSITSTNGFTTAGAVAIQGASVSIVTSSGGIEVQSAAPVTATTGNLTLTAGSGDINPSAKLTGANVYLTANGTGGIHISGGVNASGSVELRATGGGDISNSGLRIVASSLTVAGSGPITLSTTVDRMSIDAPSSTSLIGISESDGLILDSVNPSLTLSLTAGGDLTVANAIVSTRSVTLASAGGKLTINADLTAPYLNLIGKTGITSTGVLSGELVNLQSSAGNVGTGPADRIHTNADNLSATVSAGVVFIQEQNAINIGASVVSGDFDVVAGGTITTLNTVRSNTANTQLSSPFFSISAGTIRLEAPDLNLANFIASAGAVELHPSAGRTIGISANGTSIAQFNLEIQELGRIQATSLTIGDTASGSITVNANYSIPLSSIGAFNLSLVTGSTVQAATASIDMSSHSLSITASGDVSLASVTINTTVSGTNPIVGISTPGTVSVASGQTIGGKTITIGARDLILDGSLGTTGTGTVTLLPSSQSVTLGTAGTGFSLDAGELGRISASNVVFIGQAGFSGDVSLSADYNLAGSGAGKFPLVVTTTGSFTATGFSLLSDKSITVTAGTIQTGSLNSTQLTLQGSSVTVNGALNGSVVQVTAAGDLIETGNGSISGDVVALSSTAGDIGKANQRLSVTANQLSVSAIVGSVFVNQNGAVTLGASGAGNTFDFSSSGKITTAVTLHSNVTGFATTSANAIDAGSVILSTTHSGGISGIAGIRSRTGDITLSAPGSIENDDNITSSRDIFITTTANDGGIAVSSVTGRNVFLQTQGGGSIFSIFPSNRITASSLSLISATGSINVKTASTTISSHTASSTLISQLVPLSVSESNAGLSYSIDGGDVVTTGDITSARVTIGAGGKLTIGANIVGTDIIDIFASKDIITNAGCVLSSDFVRLNSTQGNIGNSADSRLNTEAGTLIATARGTTGNVFINEQSSLLVGSSAATNAFDLSASGVVTTATTVTSKTGLQSTATVAISAADLTIRATDVSLPTSLNATSSVRIQGSPSQSVAVVNQGTANSASLTIDTAELSVISTPTLIIGNKAAGGSITFAANYSVPSSGAGAFNLTFESASNYNGDSVALNAPGHSISINVGGNVSTGSIDTSGANGVTLTNATATAGGNAGNISVTATGNVTTGFLHAYGGNGGGGGTNQSGGNGGNGGLVNLLGDVIIVNGDINVSGGAGGGGGGGNGGVGGVGGVGGAGANGGTGGNGGSGAGTFITLHFYQYGDASLRPVFAAAVSGDENSYTLPPSGSHLFFGVKVADLVVLPDMFEVSPQGNGSAGGNGGNGGNGQSGGAGSNGGNGGNGGSGGNGGQITLVANKLTINGPILAAQGNGGLAGLGGAGGQGGTGGQGGEGGTGGGAGGPGGPLPPVTGVPNPLIAPQILEGPSADVVHFAFVGGSGGGGGAGGFGGRGGAGGIGGQGGSSGAAGAGGFSLTSHAATGGTSGTNHSADALINGTAGANGIYGTNGVGGEGYGGGANGSNGDNNPQISVGPGIQSVAPGPFGSQIGLIGASGGLDTASTPGGRGGFGAVSASFLGNPNQQPQHKGYSAGPAQSITLNGSVAQYTNVGTASGAAGSNGIAIAPGRALSGQNGTNGANGTAGSAGFINITAGTLNPIGTIGQSNYSFHNDPNYANYSIVGSSVNITTNSNIGESTNRSQIIAPTASFNTSGNVFVATAGAISLGRSSAATLDLQVPGAIIIAGTLTVNNLSLQSTSATDVITVNNRIDATGTVSLITNGRILAAQHDSAINAADVLLQSGGLELGTAINATGTVQIKSAPHVSIGILESSDYFLKATALSSIIAKTLIIGDRSNDGGIFIRSDLNLTSSGPGNFDLQLLNGDNVDTQGSRLNLGGHTLNIDTGRFAMLGAIASTNSVSITSNLGTTILGGSEIENQPVTGITGSSITISGTSLSLSSPLNAINGGTVTFQPSANSSIVFGGGFNANALSLTSTLLGKITAGKVIVDASTSSGGITLAGYNATGLGAGKYNLSFLTGGNFTGTGAALTSDKTVNISAAGSVNTGGLSGSNITLTGTTVNADGMVTAASQLAVHSTGNITSSGAGKLTGIEIDLTSSSGSIGTSTNTRLATGADQLVVSATNGSIYLSQDRSVTISSANAGATFDVLLSSSGNISLPVAVSTSTSISLTSSTGTVNGAGLLTSRLIDVTGFAGVNLYTRVVDTADGAPGNLSVKSLNGLITVNDQSSRLVTDIGTTKGASIYTTGEIFARTASTLDPASVSGSILINNTSSTLASSIHSLGLIARDNITLITNGNIDTIDITGTANPHPLACCTANVTLTDSVNGMVVLNAAGDVRGQAGVNGAVPTSLLVSAPGVSIGSGKSAYVEDMQTGSTTLVQTSVLELALTVHGTVQIPVDISGNKITIQGATGTNTGISLLGNIVAETSLTLGATGNGAMTQSSAASLTSAVIVLSSNAGDIGTATQAIRTATPKLSINSGGNTSVQNISATELVLQASTISGALSISSVGSLTTAGEIKAASISIDTIAGSQANITIGSKLTPTAAGANLTLTADGALVTTGTGKISGDIVSITSRTGNIGGSATDRTILSASRLTAVASKGSAFLQQDGSLTVDSGKASTTFDLLVNGNLTVAGIGADGSLKLTTTGGGNMLSSGSPLLNSPNITLSAAGDVGTDSAPLRTAAGTLLITANSAFIDNATSKPINLGASTLAGSLQVTSDGSLTTTGDIAASNIKLQTTSGSNSDINIGSKLSGKTSSTAAIVIDASGNITSTANGLLNANVITLNSAKDIGSVFQSIRTITGSLTLTGTNAYIQNLALTTLAIATSTVTNSLSLSSTGALSTTGEVSATNISIQTVAGSGATINVGSKLSANGSDSGAPTLSLVADGNLTSAAPGIVEGNYVSLTSRSGNIGTASNDRFTVSATKLDVNANSGDIYLKTDNSVGIASAQALGTFDLLMSGTTQTTSVTGNINANGVAIQANIGTNGGLFLAGAILAGNSLTLVAHGSGSILQSGSGQISSKQISLASDRNVGSDTQSIKTSADQLTINASGDAYIENTSSTPLALAQSTLGGSLTLSSGGSIATLGELKAAKVTMATSIGSQGDIKFGADASASASGEDFTVVADGNIETAGSGKITGDIASLTSRSGNLGTGTTGRVLMNVNQLTTAAQGNVFLKQDGAVIINSGSGQGSFDLLVTGNITVGGEIESSGSLKITATGGGKISGTANGLLRAPTVTLAASADIGSDLLAVKTATGALMITGANNAYLKNVSTSSLNLDTSSLNGSLELASNGSIKTIGDVSAANIKLDTSNGTAADIQVETKLSAIGAAPSTVSLSASGKITSTANGLLSGDAVIASSSSNVGDDSQNIRTETKSLKVSGGSAYITNVSGGSLSLEESTLSGSYAISSNGEIVTSGGISATTISLSNAAGSAANININSNLSATGSGNNFSVIADGNITTSATGRLSGDSISLESRSGSIGGGSSSRLFVNACELQATATTGDVYLKTDGSLAIKNAVASGTFDMLTLGTNNDITISGPVQANHVFLDTAGTISGSADGLISSNLISVNGGKGIDVETSVSDTATGLPGTIHISSANGASVVHDHSTSLIAELGPAVSVTITTTAEVFASTASSLDPAVVIPSITIDNSTSTSAKSIHSLGMVARDSVTLITNGDIDTLDPSGNQNPHPLACCAANITLTDNVNGQVLLKAVGNVSGTLNGSGGTPVTLKVDAPNVGLGTGKSAYIEDLHQGPTTLLDPTIGILELTVSGTLQTTVPVFSDQLLIQAAPGSNAGIVIGSNLVATDSVKLVADGTGNIAQTTNTVITTTNLNLTGNADIGASGQGITTSAQNLAVNGGGSAFIENVSSSPVNLGTSTVGGSLQLTSTSSINATGDVQASNIVLQTAPGTNAGINISANLNSTGQVTLQAEGGKVSQGTGFVVNADKGVTLVTENGKISSAGGTVNLTVLSSLIGAQAPSTNQNSSSPEPVALQANTPSIGDAAGSSRQGSVIVPTDTLKAGIKMTRRHGGNSDSESTDENTEEETSEGASEEIGESGTGAGAPYSKFADKLPGTNGTIYASPNNSQVLYAPRQAVQIELAGGTLSMAAGSVVFFTSTGNDVAIYNLHDPHGGSVALVVDGMKITLAPGEQLVLTRDKVGSFEKINPGKQIAYRHEVLHELPNGLRAFVSDFSITSALTSITPLKQMLSNSAHHHIAHKILKNAAIMTVLTAAKGPYKAVATNP